MGKEVAKKSGPLLWYIAMAGNGLMGRKKRKGKANATFLGKREGGVYNEYL